MRSQIQTGSFSFVNQIIHAYIYVHGFTENLQ